MLPRELGEEWWKFKKKCFCWNEEKHFGKNIWFARPNGTEDTKYGSSGSSTNDPELLRLYYWNKIENTFQMLNRDYEFSHQIFAKIALVISRFLAKKFKYGKAIKTPPIGWVNFKIVTCRTANRDQKSMKKFVKRGEMWILKIVVGLFWSHVKSPVVS